MFTSSTVHGRRGFQPTLIHFGGIPDVGHITDFTGVAEARQVESQQVFDAAVSELSERLATLEHELEENEASLQAMAADRSSLAEQLENSQQSLTEAKVTHTQLVTENDGYRGQIARMETEHREGLAKLDTDAKALANEQARERIRASDEHSVALSGQRQEMAEAAEHAENRLMVLLDQERQAAKESSAKSTHQLAEVGEKAQLHRERGIELEGTTQVLRGLNGKLTSDCKEATDRCSELSTALEDQKSRVSSIESEFEAYKKQHKISGDLRALQAAVAAMQAKLEERQGE